MEGKVVHNTSVWIIMLGAVFCMSLQVIAIYLFPCIGYNYYLLLISCYHYMAIYYVHSYTHAYMHSNNFTELFYGFVWKPRMLYATKISYVVLKIYVATLYN